MAYRLNTGTPEPKALTVKTTVPTLCTPPFPKIQHAELFALLRCGFPACERWQGCLMARFSNAELTNFRNTSRCSACVHYCGCQLWLALLLMNEEIGHPGLDILVPDITKACPMFFSWSAESARRASTGSGEASHRPH